jgi:hypothetical protein
LLKHQGISLFSFRATMASDCQPEHYIYWDMPSSRHLRYRYFRWVDCKVKDIMEASGCWWLSVKFSTITVFKIISV